VTETTDRDPDFAALGAAPALAAALTARGYTTPTPVQAAVLAAADADLMVSAQTGSGKTVAFGLLIGRRLLGDASRVAPGKAPRALVITPTRELGVQVQRELTWLLGEAGARIASFTGGTDLRGDARALARGVEVAVGTPGRLVDLLERGSLDLARVEIIVLDEADEMLDMGFREALELILSRAPTERRTLLFSATLPGPIRALANKYQRAPVPIDVRAAARPDGAAHEDIRYVAYLCKDDERLAALVNILRISDDERSLVFCRTREDVGELHRELASRGFLAAAISGDRAQAERDRALETMRAGRVRVLVATNVAARGLDLPELGLVVHADLPENVESLTHRSGRTGRAGRKGRAVFLVGLGQRRRAERLFFSAKLKLAFSTAPGLADVARHDEATLRAEILGALDANIRESAARLARELLTTTESEALVAALVELALRERPAGEAVTSIAIAQPPAAAAPRRTGRDEGFVLFEINLGAADRAVASWILPLVCRRGGVTRREVGAIRVARDRTYFEIAAGAADEFAANARERDPRAPHVRISHAERPMPERSFAAPEKKRTFVKREKPRAKGPAPKRR
jgi:ATP-dependent RNA helicase DeaD